MTHRCLQCRNRIKPDGSHCPYEDDYSTRTNYQELVANCPHFISRELTVEELEQILSLTIKRDDATKLILFLACLLTFTDSEQVNVILSGESSIGKTFTINEITWFFSDVLSFEGASKTSFIHEDSAILVDKRDMSPILYEDAPSKEKGSTAQDYVKWHDKLRNKAWYLDYSRKIIVLPDMPDTKLLATLRSLTAHDKKRCVYTITRSKDLKTKKVIIEGFFTPIYCTAHTEIDEQEISRFFLLTPEFNEAKVKEALDLIARKNSDVNYKQWYESEPSRVALKERVEEIKRQQINEVYIPSDLMEQLKDWFIQQTNTLKPKTMRDFPRLISLTKAWALLNYMCREIQEIVIPIEPEIIEEADDEITKMLKRNPVPKVLKRLYCNQTDVEVAKMLYSLIYKSNEMGLTPECLNFYEQVVYPLANNEVGATIDNFHSQYFNVNHRPLGDYRLRGMLKNLETIGLITKDTSKKPYRYFIIKNNGSKEPESDETEDSAETKPTEDSTLDSYREDTHSNGDKSP